MQNVVCIRHSDYRGNSSPNLSCRTCCGIYVAVIKAEVGNVKLDPQASIEPKKLDELKRNDKQQNAERWPSQKSEEASLTKSSRQ